MVVSSSARRFLESWCGILGNIDMLDDNRKRAAYYEQVYDYPECQEELLYLKSPIAPLQVVGGLMCRTTKLQTYAPNNHSILQPGGKVFLLVNLMAQCDRSPKIFTDDNGNTVRRSTRESKQ